MKKLKLTKISEQELKEKEMREVKGGITHVCTDSDGCDTTTTEHGSKYGTDIEAEMEDYK